MDKRLKLMFDKYANFITNNSQTTGDLETLCKFSSYFVSGNDEILHQNSVLKKIFPGKLTDNNIITEGLFSLSNLMVLFNDQLIRKELTKGQPKSVNSDTEESIKLFLTVLENVEVLLEITSKRVLGNKKKFFIIFIIQAVK